VTETLGGGAVVRLRVGGGESEGDATTEGYLPYGSVDDRIETGDPVRVQVRESAAPWTDRRPELDGSLRAGGGLVTLEPGSGTRVDARNDKDARELSGMLDLLGLKPPEGWRAVWKPPAVDADTEELQAGLDRAVAAVEGLDDAVDAAGGAGVLDGSDSVREEPLTRPNAGVWVWFGRESRFALDDRRREATATMPGHHRVKAGSADASSGVDLAEALCEPDADASFPFGVVTDAFGPAEGDALRLEHGKPDGRLITLGEATVTTVDADGSVAVEREMTGGGSYDGLDVPREAGDIAETSLKEGRWWYPTTYRGRDGTVRGVCQRLHAGRGVPGRRPLRRPSRRRDETPRRDRRARRRRRTAGRRGGRRRAGAAGGEGSERGVGAGERAVRGQRRRRARESCQFTSL